MNNQIHRFQKKKPEVAPKRGLIAFTVNIQSNMVNEEERPISDDIPGVSVSEEQIEKLILS